MAVMFQSDFNDRLLPGERILWTGRPGQGLMLTRNDMFLIPLSLMWFGFTVFWTYEVTLGESAAPLFAQIWGGMFMLIGLHFVAGRFVVDAWVRRRIQYAVTDQRVLVNRSPPFGKFSAVSLAHLPEAQLNERSDRRGTIRFGPEMALFGRRQGLGTWSPALDATPQFLLIDDARRVFDIVQRAAAKP